MSQSAYHVTVTVDGTPIGAFDSRTGGETTSEITSKHTAEGLKLRPGRATHGDLTVTRDFERERDHDLARRLEKRVGKGEVVVSEQPLDDDGNVWGRPKVWTGRLQGVNTGDANTDSDEGRELELTVSVKEVN